MTVTNLERRREYIGDGASTDFTFNIPFDLANDLKVFVDGAAQSEGFQVNGAGSPTGGSVVFTTPPETGKAVVIVLDPGLLQTLDLPNSGGGAAALGLIERGLDRSVRMIQSIADRFARAITLPEGQIDGQGRYDAGGNKFGNIGEATEASDAVSKGYLDGQIGGAVTAAQSAEEDAQAVALMRNEVTGLKGDVLQAKDQAEAARDAAQAAQPISASAKGRELIAKETEAEMRDVLGVASGVPVGSMIDWPIDAVPAFWARADGSAYSRSTYADLLNKLAPELTVTITSGSAVVTGIGSTQGFKAGMAIEGAEIPAGATIQSVDGATQITLSVNATANGTKCRVFRYGNGDGSTTFNLPNFAGRVARSWDPSGAINPDESALGVSQEDAIADIKGSFSVGINGTGARSGAFVERILNGSSRANADVNDVSAVSYEFDPSSVTNVSTETRSKSLIINKIIKVSGGVDDPAVLAAASALSDIAAAVAKADEVERVAKNKVQNHFTTPVRYSDGTFPELLGLATTIHNVKAGNAVKVTMSISIESNHNSVLVLKRNGVEIGSAPESGNRIHGLIPIGYDNNISSTMEVVSFTFIDEAPAEGTNAYTIHNRQSSSYHVNVNRAHDDVDNIDFERTASTVILEEVMK